MRLVTIVCEALAKDLVLRIARECGSHGATISPASGVGATGERPADIEESANVRIELVVPPETAARVVERIERDLFPRFACILWETDVRVLRRGKF
jgi:nitrogen regulatory protein PII